MNWQFYQKTFVRRMDRYAAAHNLTGKALSEAEIADMMREVSEEMRVRHFLSPQEHDYFKNKMRVQVFGATKRYW